MQYLKRDLHLEKFDLSPLNKTFNLDLWIYRLHLKPKNTLIYKLSVYYQNKLGHQLFWCSSTRDNEASSKGSQTSLVTRFCNRVMDHGKHVNVVLIKSREFLIHCGSAPWSKLRYSKRNSF